MSNNKYHILQQRKEERLKKAEELLEEAYLQIEYLHKKFPKTGTSENILSRLKTFIDSPIAPICTYSHCTNECEPIKQNITPLMWFNKLIGGKPKKLKIVGYKEYCTKHCDWVHGGLE